MNMIVAVTQAAKVNPDVAGSSAFATLGDAALPPIEDGIETTIAWVACVLLTGAVLLIFILAARSRRLERALDRSGREASHHLQSIARSAHVMVARYDPSGRLSYLGPGFGALTGIPIEELREDASRFLDCMHPGDRTRIQELEEARRSRPEDTFEAEYRLMGHDGQWHWIHESQTPLMLDGTLQGHDSVAFDFTDKVRFDEQQRRLLHLEQLSTTFLESFLVTDDITGTTRRMLDVLGRYFSFSGAKILERDPADDEFRLSHAWSHEGSSQAEKTPPLASISGERISWWIEQVRGGVPFTVTQDELSRNIDHEVQSLTDADSALIVPVLVLGRLELLFLIEDREQQRKWQPEELATIQTMAHAVARSLERQRLEEDRAEFAEYRRTIERTELIGHLASGIAHDFNNIVFAVSGRTQLLLKRTEDEYIRNGLEQIELALGDAKGIIGALRMMNNKVEHRTGVVAIAPATRRLTSMIRRLIPNRIGLELDIRIGNEVSVAFSADALLQVLMNLVINARDAVEEEGRIRVTIDDRGDQDRPIRMMIEDDGPGIPESMRQEVLKPFVSTKEENKGTGLGLSIVARVIRDHLGSLHFEESELGGLQVVVGMELADPISTPPESDATAAHGVPLKTVCIVEDEPVIRSLLARHFEDEGVEVIQYPDALSVGEILKDPGHDIDVLVMDIDLPEMTGVECLGRLREDGIMIPCVLMTGGFNEPPENTEHMQIIRKPFPMESLQAICSVLVSAYRSEDPSRESG